MKTLTNHRVAKEDCNTRCGQCEHLISIDQQISQGITGLIDQRRQRTATRTARERERERERETRRYEQMC